MKRMFIDSDKRMDLLINSMNKSLNLNLSIEQHNEFVFQLYKHIEHTRRISYHNGYEQGKFDEKMTSLHLGGMNPQGLTSICLKCGIDLRECVCE